MIPHHILKEVLADQLKRFTNQDPGIPRRIDPEQYRNNLHFAPPVKKQFRFPVLPPRTKLALSTRR